MDLGVSWSQLGVVIGILICWIEALPMDLDGAMNTGMGMMEMAAANVAGVALEKFQETKLQGSMSRDIEMGPFKASSAASFGGVGGTSDDSDDRRRRRSSDGKESVLPSPSSEENRHKRSPCRGRLRRTTTATPANGAGEAGGAAGAAGGAPGAGGGNADDLPRRKRSPDENDIDENSEIIPRTLGEKPEAFCEKLHQKAKETVEKMQQLMSSMTDAIKNLFSSASEGQAGAM